MTQEQIENCRNQKAAVFRSISGYTHDFIYAGLEEFMDYQINASLFYSKLPTKSTLHMWLVLYFCCMIKKPIENLCMVIACLITNSMHCFLFF